MSLRVFHIIFISVSIALSAFVALWGFRVWTESRSGGALGLAILFVVAAGALAVYGKKVFRKLKELP